MSDDGEVRGMRPKVLQHRVDALYCRVEGTAGMETTGLTRLAGQLSDRGKGVVILPIEWGPSEFEVAVSDTTVLLRNAMVRMALRRSALRRSWAGQAELDDETAVQDFGRIQLEGQALAVTELWSVIRYVREIADVLTRDPMPDYDHKHGPSCEVQAYRVDLAADVTGLRVSPSLVEGITGRSSRAKIRAWGVDEVSTIRSKKGATVYVGRGDIVCRIYDKSGQLEEIGDEPHMATEHAGWRLGGWDGQARVTRIEFQLRGKALREFRLRDLETLEERLGEVWRYLTGEWLRVHRAGGSELPVPAWRAAQRIDWGALDNGRVAVRDRASHALSVDQALGALCSALAARGLLRGASSLDDIASALRELGRSGMLRPDKVATAIERANARFSGLDEDDMCYK